MAACVGDDCALATASMSSNALRTSRSSLSTGARASAFSEGSCGKVGRRRVAGMGASLSGLRPMVAPMQGAERHRRLARSEGRHEAWETGDMT